MSEVGKLGFFANKGFIFATNFVVDITFQVYSEKYSIKGKDFVLK